MFGLVPGSGPKVMSPSELKSVSNRHQSPSASALSSICSLDASFPGVTKENMEAWEKFCQKQYLKVPQSEIEACYGKWEDRTKTLVQKQGGGMRW